MCSSGIDVMSNSCRREMALRAAYRRTRRAMYARGVREAVVTDRAIISAAVTGGAPEYYVGHKNALKLVSCYLNNSFVAGTSEMRWALAAELAERACGHIASRHTRVLSDAVAMVLNEGNATRFFVTSEHARHIIKRNKKTES